MVKCGDEALEAWMHADPVSFFLTDHYRGYGAVLVRLDTVGAGALRDLLVQSWRRLAPKRLIVEYDANALRGRRR